jgi:dephospho-CoA kinase
LAADAGGTGLIIIGVTGGLGTGKSTVARMFAHHGAEVIDADKVAHAVMEPKKLAWRQLVKAFGQEILNDDDTVNRRWLAQKVFRDPQARAELEGIVHPQVLRHIKQQLHRLSRLRRGRNRDRVKAVVLDVPLLLETGSESLVDVVVVVTAPPEVQRQRLLDRGMSEADATARMNAQWDLKKKLAKAKYVIENGSAMEQTRRQVAQLWNQLHPAKHTGRG